MSNQIIPFDFKGDQVRTVSVNDMPWFVASDVLDALDLNRSSLTSLDDDEKGVHTMDTLGGTQQVTVINEPGLYSLVLRSRKPEAKAFKRWITHEVIPAIRRTGRYEAPKSLEERSLELIGELSQKMQEQAAQLEAQKPLVDQALTYQGGDNLTTRQAFAREIISWAVEQGYEVKQQDVFRFLSHRLGLFVRGERSDAGEATTDAIRRGYAVTQKGTSVTGHNYATGKLTPVGKAYAWDRVTRYVAAHGTLRLLEVVA